MFILEVHNGKSYMNFVKWMLFLEVSRMFIRIEMTEIVDLLIDDFL